MKNNRTGKKVGKSNPPKEHQFKEGYDPKRGHRPKGARNFETDFILAAKEVAEALRLGNQPDKIKIELIKRGIKEGLSGKFPFWDKLMERLYGKVADVLKLGAEEETIAKMEGLLRTLADKSKKKK